MRQPKASSTTSTARPGGNSFDAHRLLHLAAASGLQDALKERLLHAYFTEGEAIGRPEVLQRIAVEAGLDPAEVADVLAGEQFADEVRADEQRARLLGINGVPFFAIDGRYGISGAQSSDLILSALEQAWSERALTQTVLRISPFLGSRRQLSASMVPE